MAIPRNHAESEEIAFTGHSGECRYCGGVVKMARDPETFRLQPGKCWCFGCGQRYYVPITEAEEPAWEDEQWKQKVVIDG